jgi:teichuronic acid exporter
MINNNFLKNTYFKNIILLISGAGFSQLIPVVFSPILGRIYSPHEFGVLAVFMAFCAILGMLSTGMYELSIMIPKKDSSALNLLAWVTISSGIVSVIIFFLLFVLSYIPWVASWQANFKYHYLLPLGVFFIGSFQGYTYWLNRKKEYKILNYCRIGQSITIVAVSLLLGYMGFKDSGLIFGFLAGGIVTLIPVISVLIKLKAKISKQTIILNIKTYKSYPKLMLPTSLMNITAGYVPVFSIDRFFNTKIVGSYSMAARLLTAPVSIISVVIGQVYYKRMTDIVNSEGKTLKEEFFRTSQLLFGVSLVIFLPLFFIGENIMVFVFGSQWQQAGKFVEIIAIATLIKFVVSPLSTIFLATNNLKKVALWQTVYFVTTLCFFSLALYFKLNIERLLFLYVIHECVLYLIYYLMMYHTAKKHS